MKNRTLTELIDSTDSAWSLIHTWLAHAKNNYQILPGTETAKAHTLLKLQVTTRSPMGAIAFHCGGILFDYGWLRFLGSGNSNISGNLLSWNKYLDMGVEPQLKDALIIAYDVIGGFFAINGGAFKGTQGNIFYLAPDTLEWEDMEKTYSDFLYWAIVGDLALFYQNARWHSWEEEVLKLKGEEGFSIYPPLWAKGEAVEARSRKVVPISSLWKLHMEF